jgi:hypothetical protein
MPNYKDLGEDYYMEQPYDGASWTIFYTPPGKEYYAVGYYNPKTQLLSWNDRMTFDDKSWLEERIKKNVSS